MRFDRRTMRWTQGILICLLWLGTSPSSLAGFRDGVDALLGRSDEPHPSVVQVIAPEPGALSRGSGTLIHTDGQFGYIITNWHVVRHAPGDVIVSFPDGHQSLARVLKMDEDWDLALLLIWQGKAPPMPLSAVNPQPGEPMTIAGYGGEGKYRAVRGVFTTYAAPSPEAPYDMFEVSVAARQGDSGGPIMNQRGELAGVLFGAGDGLTTGTQVHRVRDFVNGTLNELREKAQLAAATRVNPPIAQQPVASAQRSPASALDGRFRRPDRTLPDEYMPPQTRPVEKAFAAAPRQSNAPPVDFSNSDIRQWEPRPHTDRVADASVSRERWKPRLDLPRLADHESERDRRPQTPMLDEKRQPPVVSISAGEDRDTDTYGSRRPAGGITWNQLRSFFAAVGVFATLHTVTRTLFSKRDG